MSITEQEARERERAAYVRGRMVYSTLTEEALRETARLVYPDPTTYGAAQSDAEADRLDPPTPTGKTVTWNSGSYRMTQRGIEYQLDGCWIPNTTRGFIDAVVLPLLADAPDGPIPDETVDAAIAATQDDMWPRWAQQFRRRVMRKALEAVRGLPGMAVVRAAARPEVLEWGVLDGALLSLSRYKTRDDALAECSVRNHYSHDRQDGVGARVVAIIADPGEGTV